MVENGQTMKYNTTAVYIRFSFHFIAFCVYSLNFFEFFGQTAILCTVFVLNEFGFVLFNFAAMQE